MRAVLVVLLVAVPAAAVLCCRDSAAATDRAPLRQLLERCAVACAGNATTTARAATTRRSPVPFVVHQAYSSQAVPPSVAAAARTWLATTTWRYVFWTDAELEGLVRPTRADPGVASRSFMMLQHDQPRSSSLRNSGAPERGRFAWHPRRPRRDPRNSHAAPAARPRGARGIATRHPRRGREAPAE